MWLNIIIFCFRKINYTLFLLRGCLCFAKVSTSVASGFPNTGFWRPFKTLVRQKSDSNKLISRIVPDLGGPSKRNRVINRWLWTLSFWEKFRTNQNRIKMVSYQESFRLLNSSFPYFHFPVLFHSNLENTSLLFFHCELLMSKNEIKVHNIFDTKFQNNLLCKIFFSFSKLKVGFSLGRLWWIQESFFGIAAHLSKWRSFVLVTELFK